MLLKEKENTEGDGNHPLRITNLKYFFTRWKIYKLYKTTSLRIEFKYNLANGPNIKQTLQLELRDSLEHCLGSLPNKNQPTKKSINQEEAEHNSQIHPPRVTVKSSSH